VPHPTAPRSDPAAQAADLERQIRALGTSDRATQEKAYLKIDLEFLGTSVPALRGVTTAWRKAAGPITAADLTSLVRALWDRPYFECRLAAVLLLERDAALLSLEDMELLEHLLRRCGTWALVDSLAANAAGDVVRRHPETGPVLDRWARDPDFWIRRSALLALLGPLRRGGGDFDRFARYADQMLEEKEFFIRKAIGWVLRETGKRQPDLVTSWLEPRLHRASGVTVREAVKPLAPDVRDRLLASYRASRPAARKSG
jgi:3-methyladenine DNA glycosylase AlkD